MATTYADTQTQAQPIGQGMGDQNALQILMSAIGGNQDQSKSAPAKKAATTSQDTSSLDIADDHAALLRKVLTIGTAQQMSQMMAQGVTAQELAPRVDNMVKAIGSVGSVPQMSMMPTDITPAATDATNATAGSPTPPPMSMAPTDMPSTAPTSTGKTTPADVNPVGDVKDTLHMVNAPHAWTTGGFDEKGNPYDTGAGVKLLTLLAGGGWQGSAESMSKISTAASTLLDTLTKKTALAAGAPQTEVAVKKQSIKESKANIGLRGAEVGLRGGELKVAQKQAQTAANVNARETQIQRIQRLQEQRKQTLDQMASDLKEGPVLNRGKRLDIYRKQLDFYDNAIAKEGAGTGHSQDQISVYNAARAKGASVEAAKAKAGM
jgi:hypothetical protein